VSEGRSIDSDLLARYLSDEVDAAERTAVEQWASSAPENRRELEAMRAAWDLGSTGAVLPEVDLDAAWARVQAGMQAIPDARVPTAAQPALRDNEKGRLLSINGRTNIVRWLAAAAVVTGLFFGVRLWLAPDVQSILADASYVTTTLADSSTVIVSPGSKLDARMGDERRIALQGAAYFEVKRDVDRPFTVEAGDVLVTVLGTGFEVSEQDSAGTVLVRVRHGKVRVATESDTVELTSGQHVRYNKRTHLLQREAAPPMERWGDRIIQFDRAPLVQVAEQLGALFHVRIELANPALARCELTASFDNESLDAVLRVIADTFGLQVDTAEDDGHYILDGDGC